MSALDDFAACLETTEVIRQLVKSLKEEPARLLGEINREYENSGESVPDHRLLPGSFLGDDSFKALEAAGLIIREAGQQSVYCYRPTAAGREYYQKLKASGFYRDGRADQEAT